MFSSASERRRRPPTPSPGDASLIALGARSSAAPHQALTGIDHRAHVGFPSGRRPKRRNRGTWRAYEHELNTQIADTALAA